MDARVLDHISASQITTWQTCRLKWRYEREHKAAQTGEEETGGPVAVQVGKLCHEVLEYFHAVQPEHRTPDTIIGLFDELKGAYTVEVQEKASKVLNRHWQDFGPDLDYVPTDTELSLRCPLGAGLPDLVCVLDDLERDEESKTLLVGEYKTSMAKPNVLVKIHFNIQVYCIQMALDHLFPDYKVVGYRFTLLWPTGTYRETRILREDDMQRWRGYIRLAAAQISAATREPERLVYPTQGYHCERCDWFRACTGRVLGISQKEGGMQVE